ncbi:MULTISPECIES: helix-turn-helix transcriptional regulator [Actinomadura]|uniref:Helix-turn-helix domain-containing protein n=1 Tax=Actinomadura litoris TaxID=2678616 RepID=A0A7K1L445_9ACTN|nr:MULTISPECIES: helix-turn-helix transcriptional regulator [Actinomadura]MBT2210025.1 helix-turn-helix domain-containing protein [Actinomadura sp. NEAU-AAG7]MUN39150.1 helix-turn-helix domain-containing protein [Actinomadura litoris]
MENAQRPTMRSRKLGQRLRAIREERGLTLQQAARVLNRTPSSLSKLETGKRGIRRPALENMLDRYGYADPVQRAALFDLARHTTAKGWWYRYEGKLSPSMLDYISLEAEARSIRSFQLHLIPGLLQTVNYARAVIASGISQGMEPDIDGLTEIRMRRQKILFKEGGPGLWAIVCEAALRQEFGGPGVLKGQLRNLVELSKLPNVTLQVLPYSAGAHPGHNGSFTTLRSDELSVVLVENLTSGWYLENPDDIRRHDVVFDHLRSAALSPDDSRSFIERLISES